MTADVSAARQWLQQLTEAREKATPGPWIPMRAYDSGIVLGGSDGESVAHYVSVADAACIVTEHNATPRLTSALRAVLDLADELDAEVDDLTLKPAWRPALTYAADRIRAAVAAASEEGTR